MFFIVVRLVGLVRQNSVRRQLKHGYEQWLSAPFEGGNMFSETLYDIQ